MGQIELPDNLTELQRDIVAKVLNPHVAKHFEHLEFGQVLLIVREGLVDRIEARHSILP